MFGLGPATKIYISLDAVDMRKGFDGLYGMVRDQLGQDPQSGHLFLFSNRSRNQTRFCIPIGLRGCRVPLASAIWQESAPVSTNSA